MMSRFKPHTGLSLILLIYVALAVLTSWRTPLSAGPDEVAHFMFARFLRKEGYLPLTPEDRKAAGYKSDQPPLYAAVVALTFWGDLHQPPVVKLAHGAPRRHLAQDGVVDPTGFTRFWDAVNTEDPLAGEVLFWYFGRWLAIAFGALTLIVVYAIALSLFAGQAQPRRYAMAAVMNVAFIPTFIYISSVFSYESLLGLWLSLYILVAVHIIKGNRRGWLYGLAGLLVGLAIMTKLGAMPALVSLAFLPLAGGGRSLALIRHYAARAGLIALGFLVATGWWLVMVQLNLNQVNELGPVGGVLQPVLVGDGSGEGTSARLVALLSGQPLTGLKTISLAQLGRWADRLFVTFWLTPAEGPNVLSWLLYGVALLILAGWVKLWRQNRTARLGLVLLLLFGALFLVLPLVRLVMTGETGIAAQGQHALFPAIAAWSMVIVWGLSAWWSSKDSRAWVGPLALGVGWLAWSVVQTLLLQPPSPVPVRTVPPILPASAQPLEVEFPSMQLAGYDLTGLTDDSLCCDSAQPALGVKLYWVATELATQDYLETVSLVDAQGAAQSVWVGYAANGRYPSRAWEKGDIVRSETWLPLVDLSPGSYHLTLELSAADSPIAATDGRTQITLGRVELGNAPPPPGTGTTGTLWQTGQIAAGPQSAFAEWSTIQVTAPVESEVNLVGPDQVTHPPSRLAGQVRVFVVNPIWPKGDYHLSIAAAGQSAALTITGPPRQSQLPASQVQVQANFANQLMLVGYNLPQRHVQPGQALPVTLHWQALQTMAADFIMFTRLRDETGRVWGGYDRWPRENYSTVLWAAGEAVEDGFTLPIKPDTPPGIYYLDLGFYLLVGQAPVSLPLVQQGQMSEVTHVTLGPIKVGQPTGGFILASANPQFKLAQAFGETPNLMLLGYDLTQSSIASGANGSTLQVTLYWRCESPLPLDYTTFVHVRNAAGETVAQKDQPPLQGAYPTSLWSPGEIIADKLDLALPGDLPAGTYSLVVGWYDATTGARLPVPDQTDNSMTLRTVEFDR